VSSSFAVAVVVVFSPAAVEEPAGSFAPVDFAEARAEGADVFDVVFGADFAARVAALPPAFAEGACLAGAGSAG
jgi:hypothetical protein